MNKILLDTCIIIPFLRGDQSSLIALKNFDFYMSIITHAELTYGINKSNKKESELSNYNKLIDILGIKIINLDSNSVNKFAEVKLYLNSTGQKLEDLDVFIAATALSENIPLATYNLKHFQRIPNLILYQIDNEE